MITSNRQMKEECMKAWDYLQKTSGLILNAHILKKAHKIMMGDEKGVLVGGYRKSTVFLRCRIFPPVNAITRLVDGTLYHYYHPNDSTIDPILEAANILLDLINIHPFEDGNGRLCQMILSHVLMRGGCSLFPVLLRLLNKRSRRNYIQGINTIIKSLYQDNFEQNAKMLARC